MLELITGGRGIECPMCGRRLRDRDPIRLRGLWNMHVLEHRDDIIEGCEALLRRSTP